jgi:23S rRNA (adenine2030-N6)-methyltransferase
MTRQEHAAGIIFVHPTNAKHLIAPASYQPAAHPGGDAIANLHFARIGDVWKHGPLVEVLTTMRPEVYAETHAGSASYPLTPSPERSYGVYRLLQAAAAALDVDRSPYLDLLRRHANTREPVFPGSPALAMQVLGDSARYLFCDTDPASVSSIQGWAATHAIQGVQTVADDGVKAVRARVMSLDRTAAGRALVFLDPYEPFEVIDELGISAVGFLAELATSGLAALLWYGFDHASRPTTHAQLRAVTDAAAHDAVWCAEIVPSYLGDPRFPSHSGFVGSGLMGVNLSAMALRACAAYGRGLERVYRDAVALGRYDGSLHYGSLHYQQIA